MPARLFRLKVYAFVISMSTWTTASRARAMSVESIEPERMTVQFGARERERAKHKRKSVTRELHARRASLSFARGWRMKSDVRVRAALPRTK